ncbi:MAG TPA: transposase [Deltaproteobacteria bacterium]|nr:transposase [Deltaproteobacteria bacterium]
MARPLRIEYAGAFYHITCRGNERTCIFGGDADRKRFLGYLESANERHGARFHAYCLMENHYHLMLETPCGDLSRIMHHINSSYTAYYNKRHERSGHLFQGRFNALLVEKESYGLELSRYIHLNPVRAGMVQRPSEYPWSSYLIYVGERSKPRWMITELIQAYFVGEPREGYRRFVEDSFPDKNPFQDVHASTILGREKFIEMAKARVKAGDVRGVPALRHLGEHPLLERIQTAAVRVAGTDERLCRKLSLYASQVYGGYSLHDIARFHGVHEPAIAQSNRRLRIQAEKNKALREKLSAIEALLNLSTPEV